ncbi:MAG: YdcF family protein [Melioribacteraceae bacterium]|nr:YdcF family protein [Melioribacteraceae bacterium]MCF8353946.1 YdcF family protein [Melioribacteraceae bacterium]MCF8393674.1 YdcF family protein [Melioribacteraceae bacterium]MCF8419584.1 YdcF family protein [Melioribacteraceae bacterium]
MMKKFITILFPVVVLLDSFFLIYLKYKLNGLPLSEMQLTNLGNLYLVIISLALVFGGIISFTKFEQFSTYRFSAYLVGIIAALVPLLIIYFIHYQNINFPGTYIFNYPLQKLIIAGLFTTNLLIKFYLMFLIWGMLINNERYFYIKAVYLTIVTFFLLMIFAFIIVSGFNSKKEAISVKSNYKIAVVLGAAVWSGNKPSPIFKARIDKASQLYFDGMISNIQLTGGNAPGELSEAETAFNYLRSLNVDSTALIIEKNTATTMEQIKFIRKKLIDEKGIPGILIISDEFHLKRVLEMCNFFNVDAQGISSTYSLNWKKLLFYRLRESVALLLFWFFAI